MNISADVYLKSLLGIALGALFIWIGITGKLGSLLGAVIVPGAMTNDVAPPATTDAGISAGKQ